jgi:asparagine synthase (glutamine-hydrolysing)
VKTKLPEEIVWRKDKVGFEPPQKNWMENKHLQQMIHSAKSRLVSEGILKKDVLDKKIIPSSAHSSENFDWRYLSSASIF